jgi:molybdopterin synthase catalytic subunit
MTATSLDVLRTGAPSRMVADEKMDQVRELLVGEDLRRTDDRLAAIETRLGKLETDMAHRIDAMQARIEAMSGEVSGQHRAAFEELSHGITELGERIKGLSRI